MYEDITYEDILGRMLDHIPDDMDKREGSLIYNALAPAAVEMQFMYIELDAVLREAFADSASREYLIRRAAERGIKPKPATKAVLKGEFTPESLEIPIGSRFGCGTLNYVVKEKKGDGEYLLECEVEGKAGNTLFGNLIPVEYIEGLETASLTMLVAPGTGEEETESIRGRYFGSFEGREFGGNKKDYIKKTLEIPGVGAVKVYPAWNGGGTVKLTILDSEHNRANAYLLEKVQQEIDPTQDGEGAGIAPIGHVVMVDTPEEYAVDVDVNAVYDTGYSFTSLGTQISGAIDSYLHELRKGWQEQMIVVRKTQIESRILGITGIVDITGITLNGKEENIIMDEGDIPVIGEVRA